MMDLIALGILIICFGCVKLFANSWNFSFITCRISCVCADTSGEIVRKEKGQQQEEERCYRLYSHWQFS